MLRRAVTSKVGLVRWMFGALVAAALMPTNGNAQVTFTVGAGGTHSQIQAAVNACPTAGCVINLTDTSYLLTREIWIEGKNNLAIQAAPSLQLAGIKPRISFPNPSANFNAAGTSTNPTDPARPAGWKKWPNSCLTTAGGSKNTSNEYSTSGFQHNGMLMVYKSTNVRVEGIALDGRAPQHFANRGIWNCQWDVLFGNVGVNLFQSKNVVLRNNELKNFFASIYMQNRNVGGAFAAPNPDDLDVKSIVPYSAFGKVGDHLIEKNFIHNNWWGIYNEMEWDIGSTIRYNILDSNFNRASAGLGNNDSTSEFNNMAGGFMYVKDVMIVPHKIYNNTMNGSVLVIGHGGFKPGIQHYFYNNLLTGWNRKDPKLTPFLNDYRQLLGKYKDFLYNNTFELGVDSAFQIQQLTSEQIPDSLACVAAGQVGQKSCYLPFDTRVDLKTGIQFGKALWDNWTVTQGGYFTAFHKTKQYRIFNSQVVDVFGTNSSGIIQKVQGVSNVQTDISAQANYWARTIKYKSIIPGTAGYLEPSWGDATVDSTVLDKGWVAAGNRDQDGSMPDRGAIPKSKGALTSPLTLKDQTIVTMAAGSTASTKKVSFQYCLDGVGSWSNLEFEMKNYYRQVGRRSIDPATGNDKDPWIEFSAPVPMSSTSQPPAANQCNTFTAEVATPVDSFARFELIVKGDLNGQAVRSNVGVWIWRKTQYILDVFFTKPGTMDTVRSVRVGDPVDMHVRGLRTDNGTTISTIDVLSATPDKNTFLIAGNKQIAPGDTIGKALAGAGTVFPVFFTQTGTVTITMAGMVGSLPVPGSGSITVRPGLPEKVIWQVPPTYSLLDHSLPLDDVAYTIPQAPTPVALQVVDRFGNPVDTIANVLVSALRIDGLITSVEMARTVAGPFNTAVPGPLNFQSDITGKVDLAISLKGVENQKLWGFANVVGKTSVDSGLMRVGKQLEQLFFKPVTAIDTFITVRQKVHLILSEDGSTVKTGSAFATATVRLQSSLGTAFYSSATATTPTDSVVLVAGEADVWVTSLTPVKNDTLRASNFLLGQGLPAVYTPVSFRMPPLPPAPVPNTAGFVDVNCDGIADSIDVQLKDPAGVSDKLGPKVRIDSIHVVYGAVDLWLKSGWRILTADSSKVRVAVPVAPVIGAPTGQIQFAYTVQRPPLLDTSYATVSVVIGDRVKPALRDTAYLIENFNRPAQNDTIKVRFTEALTLPASGWSFLVSNVGNTAVTTTTLTTLSATVNPTDPTRWTLVFSGNTAGTLLAQGYKLRLDPTSGITDAAGNLPAVDLCSPGVPVVEIASPVPVRKVWLKDATGDGRADRLYVQLAKPSTRSLKASDLPASVRLTWGGAFDTVTVSGAGFLVGTDSTIWELGVGPMGYGLTIGYDATGRGSVAFSGAGRIGENYPVEDSVAPIALQASLTYAPSSDILTVRYSEPVKFRTISGAWMVWKSGLGADANLEVGSGVPTIVDPYTVTFPLVPGSVLNPNPGDSTRLPLSNSRIIASNGTEPNGAVSSPYVVIIGGDRPPRLAWYKDENADGVVDAAYMVFTVPLKTSPTYEFRLGSESRPIDSTNGLVIAADRLSARVSFAAVPFTLLKTDINALDSLGTMSSKMGAEGVVSKFPIQDSVPPVIVTARMRYSATASEPGSLDTLKLVLSEPFILSGAGTNVVWGLKPGSARQLTHGPVVKAPQSTTEIWVFFPSEGSPDNPGNGDSVRLAPIDRSGEVSDTHGNAPTFLLGKWTPVQAGQRPSQFAIEIYPMPLLVLTPGTPDPIGLGTGSQVTVWIKSTKQTSWTEVTGSQIGTRAVDTDPTKGTTGFDGLGVGPKLKLNGPFEATALIYDNLGTFVGQTSVRIDTAMIIAQGLDQGTGTFEVYINWNGKDAKGKPAASGVYMFRVVAYHDVIDENTGVKGRKMLLNQITKVGVKIPQP
jgi:hypothetical protein